MPGKAAKPAERMDWRPIARALALLLADAYAKTAAPPAPTIKNDHEAAAKAA